MFIHEEKSWLRRYLTGPSTFTRPDAWPWLELTWSLNSDRPCYGKTGTWFHSWQHSALVKRICRPGNRKHTFSQRLDDNELADQTRPQEIQMHGDGAHPTPYELNMEKLIEQVFWGAARAPPGRAEGLWGCIGMENGVRPRTGITITLSLSAEGGGDWGLDDWEAQCRERPERT